MKTIYIYILAILLTGTLSCTRSDEYVPNVPDEQEVELTIFMYSQNTRAAVPDPGTARERLIHELDMLIFKDNKYQYSRQAIKITASTYKVNLKVDDAVLAGHVFANCRAQLAAWEASATQDDKSWETVQAELIDLIPSRLVSDQREVLPMWGKTSGTVSQTQVSGWGTVSMLRSVASVDVYVEQNAGTDEFILTDAHLYYAPDRGFLAPEPDGTGYKLTTPPDMQTTLNTLRASRAVIVSMDDGTGGTVTKDAIAGQLYLYDNDMSSSGIPATRKYTRLILAGYYDQSVPDPDPISGEDRRVKTYYPLDFVGEDGNFHDIRRNYKYVFNITSVNGEGYGSLEEAAEQYPINMDVNVIEWNREDEHIGVQGKYYLSMERRDAVLWSKVGTTDNLKLTYEILDQTPGASFSISFTSQKNGIQTPPTGASPWPDMIENDYFRVRLVHNTTDQTAEFIVEALQNHTPGHDSDRVEIRFRDLRFYITITQLDMNGWDDGGEIPADI